MFDDVQISPRNCRVLQIHAGRFFAQDRSHRVYFGFASERSASGHEFVENRAEAEDVAAVIDRLAPQLFWRHVSDRADHRAVLGHRGHAFHGTIVGGRSLLLGHTEIQNFDASIDR